MIAAGLPATTALSGTSRVTTEPAPTSAFSPTVIPGHKTLPPPIRAARNIRGRIRFKFQCCAAVTDPLVVDGQNPRSAENLRLDNDTPRDVTAGL